MMKNTYLLLLMLVMVSCGKKPAGIEESIVYLKQTGGNFDLYKIDVLGQWEERLTTNTGWDWSARWNPGLEKLIYYTNDTSRNFSVVALNIADMSFDTLPNPELLNYQLTPNGERIVFTQPKGDAQNIWWCKLDGSDRKQLTNSVSYNGRFTISPNSEQMAFISDRSGSNELYLLNLKTGLLTRLTENDLIEKYITWSPDNEQIAFTMRANREGALEDIYMIKTDGSGLRQLTRTPYAEQEIAWSLNGDKIAFHGTTESDGDQIYTIDIADGKFTKITSGDFYHGEPAWLPSRY